MRRVLVVHHDIDLADQEADSLRRQGFEVEQCSGPTTFSCPVMRGEPCPAAHRADVLVYDVWASGEAGGAQRLVEGLRELHPDVPVVLTAPGIELDWVEVAGRHRVVPLVGTPTGARLAEAISQALAQSVEPEVAVDGVAPTA
jgi:DNA-binding NtrC family response regulator